VQLSVENRAIGPGLGRGQVGRNNGLENRHPQTEDGVYIGSVSVNDMEHIGYFERWQKKPPSSRGDDIEPLVV